MCQPPTNQGICTKQPFQVRASSGRVSGSITSSSYRANTMTCAILLMHACHTVPGSEGNRFGSRRLCIP